MSPRRRASKALLFGLFLGLSGCAGAASRLIPDPPALAPIRCPPLVSYSTLEQAALAGELPQDGPETQAQIEDYLKLRSACRN